MTVRAQQDRRHPEGGGDPEQHADVVDVSNRFAYEDGRGRPGILREHLVQTSPVEDGSITTRDDPAMDREAGDGFEEILWCDEALDVLARVAFKDRFEPPLSRARHEYPAHQSIDREHLLDDQGLFPDEDAGSTGGTASVAVLDVPEVLERRIVRICDLTNHGRIVPDTLRIVASDLPIGASSDDRRSRKHVMTDSDTSQEPGPGRRRRTVIEDPAHPSPEDRRVAELLGRSIDASTLVPAIGAQSSPDAADSLEALDEAEAADVLEGMELGKAADALSHMVAPLAVSVLEDIVQQDPVFAARLLAEMSADDAVDLLQLTPDGTVRSLLRHMSAESRVVIEPLLAFDPQTAGGMMEAEVLKVFGDLTVKDAVELVRTTQATVDSHYVFVVERSGTLAGVIGLRQLVISGADERLIDICETQVAAIGPDTDQEEVAREFEKYEYRVLPVVDESKHLLGVVTIDAVIESIREEGTEDAQKMVGAGREEMVFSSIPQKLKGRLPWLVVNLVTSAVAAMVVLQFEGLIAEIAILAVLMPVIANQSGNAGQQSLAVTLRGLVLDQVNSKIASRLLFREATVGFINGLIAGALVGCVVTIIAVLGGDMSWSLGLIIAISMTLSITIGTATGTALPLLMRRCGADPATASTIFLTMVTDSISFLIFLGTASLFAGWFELGR